MDALVCGLLLAISDTSAGLGEPSKVNWGYIST